MQIDIVQVNFEEQLDDEAEYQAGRASYFKQLCDTLMQDIDELKKENKKLKKLLSKYL